CSCSSRIAARTAARTDAPAHGDRGREHAARDRAFPRMAPPGSRAPGHDSRPPRRVRGVYPADRSRWRCGRRVRAARSAAGWLLRAFAAELDISVVFAWRHVECRTAGRPVFRSFDARPGAALTPPFTMR